MIRELERFIILLKATMLKRGITFHVEHWRKHAKLGLESKTKVKEMFHRNLARMHVKLWRIYTDRTHIVLEQAKQWLSTEFQD